MMINKRLLGVCDESTKYVKLTIFFNWIGLVCNMTIIWLVGQFINQMLNGVVINRGHQSAWMAMNEFKLIENLSLLMGFFLVTLFLCLRFLSHYFTAKFSYLASANARMTLRYLIYDKLLRLGMNYQDQEKTATIVQLTVEGVEQLEVYFGKYLPQLFYALLAPLTLFMVVTQLSWQVALVFILGVPLIPISIMVIMRIAKRILKDYWNQYSNLGDRFLENLQGLTVLKVFTQDEKKHEQMNEEAEKFRKVTMKVLSMQLNSINVMDLIAFGGAALGIIIGLYQFRSGLLQGGDLIIIILLSAEFFIPLRLLGSYFHVAMNGMTATDRIFALLDRQEDITEHAQTLPNQPCLEIKVQNVCFSYDGKRHVLKDVSLSLASSGVTAIVGESGSGKSTLVSLLLKQKLVTRGAISVNGIQINEIVASQLYERISHVSAHSHIFKGTIRENLLMAKKDASDKELHRALKLARIDKFVTSLPEGIDSHVLENASSLSSGQKQRLALVRTILADRDFIIFDEATSNIDVESEELIWDSIYELAQSKMILVISHRLASVRRAKMIHVFKDGKIVQSGTHKALMKAAGVYAKMNETQQQLEELRSV